MSVPKQPPLRHAAPIIENTSPERVPRPVHDRQGEPRPAPSPAASLRREIPDGDAGTIVERALALLLAKVEAPRSGGTKNPRPFSRYPSRDG
jgi:hypothetical protein